MKFVILTILILFAAEGLLQASAVKTPINAILRNAPKIVKGLKKASNAILTKDQSSKLKNVLRIRDGLDQETWYKIEQSVTFFKKVKELLPGMDPKFGMADYLEDGGYEICRTHSIKNLEIYLRILSKKVNSVDY